MKSSTRKELNAGEVLLKQYAADFKALSPFISAQDRKDAAAKFETHTETVNRYLRGEGRVLHVGANFRRFFQACAAIHLGDEIGQPHVPGTLGKVIKGILSQP